MLFSRPKTQLEVIDRELQRMHDLERNYVSTVPPAWVGERLAELHKLLGLTPETSLNDIQLNKKVKDLASATFDNGPSSPKKATYEGLIRAGVELGKRSSSKT